MSPKKLSILVASLIFLIFFLNYVVMKLHLYYSLFWFDMFMHSLGGLWLGFMYFWLFSTKEFSAKLFFRVLGGVLLIGILWEFFEIFSLQYLAGEPFDFLDTLSDLFFDLLGGSVAYLVMSAKKNTI